MAAESEFPKVDGDIYFASEVNRANKNNQIGTIVNVTNVDSGTGYSTVGSLLVEKDDFNSSKGIIRLDYKTSLAAAGRHNIPQIFISGTQNNFTSSLGSLDTARSVAGRATVAIDDANNGYVYGTYDPVSTSDQPDIAGNVRSFIDISVPQLNPGSAFVVFFQVSTSVDGRGFQYAQADFFGGD